MGQNGFGYKNVDYLVFLIYIVWQHVAMWPPRFVLLSKFIILYFGEIAACHKFDVQKYKFHARRHVSSTLHNILIPSCSQLSKI